MVYKWVKFNVTDFETISYHPPLLINICIVMFAKNLYPIYLNKFYVLFIVITSFDLYIFI